ncbi:MAG: sigma-70 family RNA polymerase sigma factor [Polyangiaceae bacterium]|nr:sigma-70 family RNA polymerase sigma factor [Polyangiaceae bacterium]MCW5789514.1 sigma-70 family RNA polymerase sigma factor [Polyangiaceae bacterium]
MTSPPDPPEVSQRFHDHLDLCEQLARRIGRQVPRAALDELMSFAREGLFNAARRYEPERGVPFRAYARYRIQGAIYDGLRQVAHLPRSVHARLRAEEAAANFSEGALEDLHAAPRAKPAEAEGALQSHLASMATAIAAGVISQTTSSGPPEAIERAPSAEEQLERAQLLALLREALVELPEQQRALVERHYFGGERFDHIAEELGLSKSWASRLHTRAITTLTKRLQQRL